MELKPSNEKFLAKRMKYTFSHAGEMHSIELTRSAEGYTVRYRDRTFDVQVRETLGGAIRLTFGSREVTLHAAPDGDRRWVAFEGQTYQLQTESNSRKHTRGAGDAPEGVLRAPMPGQVRAVNVSVGEEVTKGQSLLILEAMKMEIRIQSPYDGAVAAVPVAEGDQVEKGQVVAEIR